MYSQESDTNCILKGKINNVKNLSHLLRCINFKEVAVVFASSNGLKVVVEDAKCVQAAAFIGTDIFQEFQFSEELVSFRLDLNVLLECLTMFDNASGHTSLNMYYRGHGFPLRLVLVEEEVITDCSLKTMEALEILHFTPPGENVQCKMIADGAGLKDLLSDMDSGSEYVDITMSERPAQLVVSTESVAGRCEASVVKEAEWVEEFSSRGKCHHRYKYSQIKHALKTLQAATKISIQMTREGLLCMQFMVMTESKQLCYIEYYSTPVLIDEGASQEL